MGRGDTGGHGAYRHVLAPGLAELGPGSQQISSTAASSRAPDAISTNAQPIHHRSSHRSLNPKLGLTVNFALIK